MKKRIVLWGADAEEKKILVALELLAEENKVRILSFTEAQATETFYDKMMKIWRSGGTVEMPENHFSLDRDLSITEGILPDNIKVDRTDVVNTAKTEWHFIVLSSKMYEMYKGELDGLKEKVGQLTSYDKDAWGEMKEFWTKVQKQVTERNLFREHANDLRKTSDSLFDRLKELRSSFDNEFKKLSKEYAAKFLGQLEEIEGKIEKDLGLKPIFNQLKEIQKEFQQVKFTKDDRNKIWNKIDAAFKVVKEKRFGSEGQQSQNAMNRIQKRYDGLMSAIGRMEKSIQRDKRDKEFENKKVGGSASQLEVQLREAKLMMIDDRISSKEIKHADMLKTQKELERRMEKEKKLALKREEKNKINEAKSEIKEKIASEIKEKSQKVAQEKGLKLKKAADDIVASKAPKKAAVIPPVPVVPEAPKADKPVTELVSESKPEPAPVKLPTDAEEKMLVMSDEEE